MKYSEHAIDEAITAIQESSGASVNEEVLAVFDSLERAPWWEEVEVGYEFQNGEPCRYEHEDGASECIALDGRRIVGEDGIGRHFRDTTWKPPVKPLKEGDLIDTEEQAASLPIGTIAVSMANEPIRKASIGVWRRVNAEHSILLVDIDMAGDGDRIIYLPSGVSE